MCSGVEEGITSNEEAVPRAARAELLSPHIHHAELPYRVLTLACSQRPPFKEVVFMANVLSTRRI